MPTHESISYPQLLNHRPHRPRQVDPCRSSAGVDGRPDGTRNGGTGPRQHGSQYLISRHTGTWSYIHFRDNCGDRGSQFVTSKARNLDDLARYANGPLKVRDSKRLYLQRQILKSFFRERQMIVVVLLVVLCRHGFRGIDRTFRRGREIGRQIESKPYSNEQGDEHRTVQA